MFITAASRSVLKFKLLIWQSLRLRLCLLWPRPLYVLHLLPRLLLDFACLARLASLPSGLACSSRSFRSWSSSFSPQASCSIIWGLDYLLVRLTCASRPPWMF